MLGKPCTICLEATAEVPIDDCSHAFCRECLAHWLRKSDLCPLCKVFVLSVEGRSRCETFPAAEPFPPEDAGPAPEHFALELRSLLSHLQVLERQLDFYRHQAFYGALRDRIFLDMRGWNRALDRLHAGEDVAVEVLRKAVEDAHLLASCLESGLGPAGPAGLAWLVEEGEEGPY